MSLAWGRVFFVFGPHEHPARLAGSVAGALVAGQEALCSHGEQVRDFLYAPELAAAFVALLRSDVTGPVNMASGEAVALRELIEALAAAAGRPDLVRLGARPSPPRAGAAGGRRHPPARRGRLGPLALAAGGGGPHPGVVAGAASVTLTIDVAVVAYRHWDLTRSCLEHLARQTAIHRVDAVRQRMR